MADVGRRPEHLSGGSAHRKNARKAYCPALQILNAMLDMDLITDSNWPEGSLAETRRGLLGGRRLRIR